MIMAADDSTSFTYESAERIADSVRAFEAGDRKSSSIARAPGGNLIITAKITSQDGTDGWKYAWEQVYREDGVYTPVSGGLTGTVTDRSAFDLNENADASLVDKIVHLRRTIEIVDDEQVGVWEIVGASGGGSIDAKHADVDVALDIAFINIGTTRGTDQILELVAQTIGADDGAKIEFTPPGTSYHVLQWNGSNVVWDEVRATA